MSLKSHAGILSASPSWYCSRVSDCHPKGIFIFGAKNSIYLLDLKNDSATILDFLEVHNDRVTGVSVCKQETEKVICCTTSDDKKVKIWDVDAKVLKEEHTHHMSTPTAVHWSNKLKSLIVSGDAQGSIIAWNLETRTVQQFLPEKSHVFSLECSPVNENLVVTGYKNGTIVIFDISGKGSSVHRLRGHDDEVHTVTWCPLVGEDIRQRTEEDATETKKKEDDWGHEGHLLASGSRDRTIRVWSTSKGRAVLTQKLPTNTGFKRGRNDEQSYSRDRVWVTLHWLPDRPRHLLSSTHSGELLLWDLCRPGKQKWDVLAGPGHSRIIFNIAMHGNTVCTISMDRTIVVWDLESMASRYTLPTLGGFPYGMVCSPLNPGLMAVGVGDNMVRVWNYANPNNGYDVTSHWQGIKAKVTCVCWHPEREGALAYGTDDGRVGIMDVLSHKAPLVSSTYHRRTVYVVAWGPRCPITDESKSNAYMLYSCGDGNVLLHNPSKLDKEAVDFCSLINTANGPNYKGSSRSEITWKPDFSVVVLGNEDGGIDVFRSCDLQLLCSIQVHRKLINVCRWHPEYTAQSSQPSPFRYWLATGSNESNIHVVDLQKAIEGDSQEKCVITESFSQLEGHTNRVTGLSWSIHQDAMLASASYDGTAQVWNVRTGAGVANYRGHCNRVMSVMWSAVDPNLVYSGGDDFTIQCWNIHKQEHKTPPKAVKRKNKKKKGPQESSPPKMAPPMDEADIKKNDTVSSGHAVSVASAAAAEWDEVREMLEQKKRQLMQEQGDGMEEDTASTASSQIKTQPMLLKPDAAKKEGRKDKKHRKAKSMFPVYSSMENRGKMAMLQDCVDLASHIYSRSDTGDQFLGDDLTHLGIYTDRRNTYRAMDKEGNHHAEHSNTEQQVYLDMWTGNITGMLDRAKQNHQLDDWLVALAPLASPKTWRETCEIYAQTLASDGQVHKAVTYLLAANMLNKAISLLTDNRMFKEAIHLAQVRLSPADPLLAKLYKQWASQLTAEGNYEHAAKCFLALKQPLEAAKLIARRNDLSSLKTAIELTLKADEMTASKTYTMKYLQDCMLKYKWLTALEIAPMHFTVKCLSLPVVVHEALVQSLASMQLYNTDEQPEPSSNTAQQSNGLPKFLVNPEKASPLCLWGVHLKDGQSLPLHIISRWYSDINLNFKRDKLNECAALLREIREAKQSHTHPKQVLIAASLDVTLGLLSLLQCDMDSATYWLTTAMATCHQAGHRDLLQGLCRALLPLGPENLPRLQQEVTALRLVAAGDPAGTLPSDLTRRPSVSCDLGKVIEDLKVMVIGNSTEMCTSVDCLAAFYYLAVLTYIIGQTGQTKSEKTVHGKSAEVSVKDMKESTEKSELVKETESSESNRQPKESSVDPMEANNPENKDSEGRKGGEDLTHNNEWFKDKLTGNLVRLTWYLLWESQVRKRALMSSIEHIKKQLSLMLTEGQILDDFVSQLNTGLSRAISGEYLSMTPSKKKLDSTFSAAERESVLEASFAGSECEWVDMKDPNRIESPAAFNGTTETTEHTGYGDIPSNMSSSSLIAGTHIYTRAHSIFSDLSQSVLLSGATMASEADETQESQINQQSYKPVSDEEEEDMNCAHLKNGAVKKNEDAAVSTHEAEMHAVRFTLHDTEDGAGDAPTTEDEWSEMPNNWALMPTDTRYNLPNIPAIFLTQQLKLCEKELVMLNAKLPNSCPFPDVMESCKLFLQLQTEAENQEQSFKAKLIAWGLCHCYLAEHMTYFTSLQENS